MKMRRLGRLRRSVAASILAGACALGTATSFAAEKPETYLGSELKVVLVHDDAAACHGTLTMKGNAYPFTGKIADGVLSGEFETSKKAFPFTARVADGGMTLETGGKTYGLQQALHAEDDDNNPLDQGGDAKDENPLDTGTVPNNTPKHEEPAPRRDRSLDGFAVIAHNDAGATLYASVPTRSAAGAVAATAQRLGEYFDAAPTLGKCFGDRTGGSAMAGFAAKINGKAINGSIMSGVGEQGTTVTVLFALDGAPRELTSQLLGAIPVPTRWETAQLPDGSGQMNLPTGWKITSAAKGAVDAAGPSGESVSLGIAWMVWTPEKEQAYVNSQIAAGMPNPQRSGMMVVPYCGPVDAIKALTPILSDASQRSGGISLTLDKLIEAVPVQGQGQAAYMHYSWIAGNRDAKTKMRTLACVATMPAGDGIWMCYTSSVSAPDAIFDRTLPDMMKIWGGWKVDAGVLNDRMTAAMESMKQSHEIWQKSQEYAAKVDHDTNANFCEVIRGYRTIEDTTTGERHEANLGYVTDIVDALNKYEPGKYVEVPLRNQ